MYYPTSLVRRFWSTRKRNEIRVFGATPRAVALNRSAFCGCANAMRHAMQLGFRNRTEFIPPAGLVLWQDAAVNHEKNESARSQRRRPSHRVSHDRFPLSHVNSGQCLWLLCSMRVGNSAFRGISTPSAGINGRHDPQNAWTGRLVTPQYPSRYLSREQR